MTYTELLSLVAAQLLAGQQKISYDAAHSAVLSANRIVASAKAMTGNG